MKDLTKLNVAALNKARKAKKVNLAQLAELTHITRGTLSKLFNGKSQPRMETVVKVGKALDLQIGLCADNEDVLMLTARELAMLRAGREFEEES